MVYIYLAIAITAEVIATSALKASSGFTRVVPGVIVILGYGIAFYCLAIVLKTMPVGVAYAIWSGLGILLITVVGFIAFNQKPDLAALLGMALIIAGVVVINLFSTSVSH